jgi:glycosyltransferase involved in cell wall biosynthesis
MFKFSVVINTYNRGTYLNDAILGLHELNYPSFEVVVVNGPSTDNTVDILKRWEGRIKIGNCPVQNLSMSRNTGIQMAAGDVIAFIDDDAVPHPEWLTKLSSHYSMAEVGAVGGFTIDNTGVAYQVKKTVCDRFGNAYFPNDFFDERPLSSKGSPMFPSLLGTNSSFRTAALRDVGGFDHVFAYMLDETDVCLRLVDRGYKIVYEPDALVFHQFAPSHIRNGKRIPKTLYPSAVSKSYFIHRHGGATSEKRARDEIRKYEDEILSANKWLCDHGEITLKQRISLDDDLLFGIQDGTRKALEKALSGNGPLGGMDLDSPVSEFLPTQCKNGLRIALISRAFPPAHEAGIARWTSMMARGLADRGHKVHVVTLATDLPCTHYEHGYWVHFVSEDHAEEGVLTATRLGIPLGLAGWCFAVYQTVQSLKTFGLDVVSFPIWDVEGMMVAGDASIGIVLSLHTSYALAKPFKPEWTERPLFGHFHVGRIIAAETRMLKEVKHILGNSEAIVNDLENAYGVCIRDKVVVAPHGTFEPMSVESNDLALKQAQARHGVPVRITYVGRFESRKGFDIACDSFRRVLDERRNIKIQFVGDELDNESIYIIHSLDAAVLLSDKRVSFRGMVSRKELDSIYMDSDIVVMPSRYESFGLVAIEAMSASTPVIALRSGGLAEVVQDGVTGYLIEADVRSGEAIAERIMTLVDEPATLKRMMFAARKAFETRFTVDRMVDAAEPVYYAAAGVQHANER